MYSAGNKFGGILGQGLGAKMVSILWDWSIPQDWSFGAAPTIFQYFGFSASEPPGAPSSIVPIPTVSDTPPKGPPPFSYAGANSTMSPQHSGWLPYVMDAAVRAAPFARWMYAFV